jgi:hypothetical protein
MPFNFAKEMSWGNKHCNILQYENASYDFRPFLKDCFNCENIDELHINNPNYKIFTEFGPDVRTWYHKTFYSYLDSEKGNKMKDLYYKLIKDVILPYLNLSEAYVQKFPSFRVHLPNNVAVAKKHTDNSLGHPIGEINFTYVFTNMFDSNSICIEKMPRMNEYVNLKLDENNIISFNGNLCMHYNNTNETNKTRVSMDFRILPVEHLPKDVSCSHSTKRKFTDGDYYKYFSI